MPHIFIKVIFHPCIQTIIDKDFFNSKDGYFRLWEYAHCRILRPQVGNPKVEESLKIAVFWLHDGERITKSIRRGVLNPWMESPLTSLVDCIDHFMVRHSPTLQLFRMNFGLASRIRVFVAHSVNRFWIYSWGFLKVGKGKLKSPTLCTVG